MNSTWGRMMDATHVNNTTSSLAWALGTSMQNAHEKNIYTQTVTVPWTPSMPWQHPPCPSNSTPCSIPFFFHPHTPGNAGLYFSKVRVVCVYSLQKSLRGVKDDRHRGIPEPSCFTLISSSGPILMHARKAGWPDVIWHNTITTNQTRHLPISFPRKTKNRKISRRHSAPFLRAC